jgi:hypothetical protein
MRVWETTLRLTQRHVDAAGVEVLRTREHVHLSIGRKPVGIVRTLANLPRYMRERIVAAELVDIREQGNPRGRNVR